MLFLSCYSRMTGVPISGMTNRVTFPLLRLLLICYLSSTNSSVSIDDNIRQFYIGVVYNPPHRTSTGLRCSVAFMHDGGSLGEDWHSVYWRNGNGDRKAAGGSWIFRRHERKRPQVSYPSIPPQLGHRVPRHALFTSLPLSHS